MTEQDLGGNETLPVAQEPRSGFSITGGKGFHMRFENGWTVSVQFGPYNYCSRRNTSFETLQTSKEKGEEWGSETAEIAAWPTKGEWYSFGDDTVAGHESVAEVLAFMQKIAALPPDSEAS